MQGKSRSSAVFPESRLRPENAPTYWRSRFARTTVPWPEAEKHRLWPRPTKCTSLRYRRQRGPRGVWYACIRPGKFRAAQLPRRPRISGGDSASKPPLPPARPASEPRALPRDPAAGVSNATSWLERVPQLRLTRHRPRRDRRRAEQTPEPPPDVPTKHPTGSPAPTKRARLQRRSKKHRG